VHTHYSQEEKMIRKATILPVLLGAFALGACDDPTGGGELARLSVELTDAPSEYVAAANVDIGRIEIIPADGPPQVVVEDAGSYDLLTLQNGVTAALGSIDIEAGTYLELRMVVESAAITLVDGYTFNDGSQTKSVAVPSGAQTGIKIRLSSADGERGAGVDIRPGETVLVVDFDVSQNFVMQGDPDTAAGIQDFLFTPLLRAVVKDVAGSIAGTVTAPAGVAVEGLSVVATASDAAVGDAPATALVAADGTYKINFLAPGTFSVTVQAPEAHTANTVEVTVGESENVTGVALTISAS
jgi:hypothetical protein